MDNNNKQIMPVSPVPVVQQKRELVLEGDPEQQLEFAKKAATALMRVVKPVKIANKDYLQFGGWQTLGRFFGATVGVEWSKRIEENGKLLGYEARAVVHQHGEVISSAEAVCMKSERRWGSADEYAVKSMAQTRASAKALRNAFGWVAELAGLESTPAEEMEGVAARQSSASVPEAIVAKVKNASTEDELKAIWNEHKGLGKDFAKLVTEHRDFIRSVKAKEVQENHA